MAFQWYKKIFIKHSYAFLFFLWLLFFVTFFYGQLKIIPSILKLYFLSDEQKFQVIDRNYYKFMKLCKDLIPENADVIFELSSRQNAAYGRDWYLGQYFDQKAPYYLYPRRIYKSDWIKYEDGCFLSYNRHRFKWEQYKNIEYRIVYDSLSKQFKLFQNNKLLAHATY